MVEDPAARVVMGLGDLAARGHQLVQGIKQRLGTVGKGGWLGWPVVHLGVDVAGVFAVPRRAQALVPDALQVGGLAAGTARPDQQVTTVLEHQGGQARIVAGAERGQARVCGRLRGVGLAEVQAHPAEQGLVVGDMLVEQLLPGLAGGPVRILRAALGGVSGDVAEVLEVGADDQLDHQGRGA